jgi:hypothetical protein
MHWISAAPTSEPMSPAERAWTRTPLLEPKSHQISLRLRHSSDPVPRTVTVNYPISPQTFCAVTIRLSADSVSFSECEWFAPMSGRHPLH